jgi:hypothetical protein
MSNFLTNIQKLKREVKSIQELNKNEDKLNNQIDYKALYDENKAKLEEITIHAKNIENKFEEVKEEYSNQETKFKKIKSEFDKLKNYKEENYFLKDTIIQLQNEIRCSKNIKFIDNLKEEINNLNDGIDFWKGDSGDMENNFNLEKNNHGKTKLKLKNLSNYCDDLKINHATEIDDLKEKLEKTNKKYNTLIVNIKKFFE